VNHGVPAPYAFATRLDADANACLSLARAKWHTLTRTQQRALVDAYRVVGGRRLERSIRAPTVAALVAQGLVEGDGRRLLTGFGHMVREAGIYARRKRDSA
jgi:hypothetical protein